jgi:signal transduction histidine kinase
VERLTALDAERATDLARQHRMLMSEGLTLFLLLFAGGASLLYYIWKEMRRGRQIREFFAAFTHDLKTSLARVRLQAESLEEDLRAMPQAKILRRLVRDTVRLELQLENSLFLSSPASETNLFLENIALVDEVAHLRHQWPDLEIAVEGSASLRVDRRALESIFKNLLQNSVVHGKASQVRLRARNLELAGQQLVEIAFADNGMGFAGDLAALGQIFRRHSPTSGSGIGVPLAIRLARQMGGSLRLVAPPEGTHGFCALLVLPGAASPFAAAGGKGQGEATAAGAVAPPAKGERP